MIDDLGQFFVKNAKNDLRTLFEQPKSDKILKIVKMWKNPGNSVKNGHFGPSKCHKLAIFLDIGVNFVHIYIHVIGDRVLSDIFRIPDSSNPFIIQV